MASFKLDKGDKFAINKSISRVLVGLGWDVGQNPIDIDAHAFGCVAGPKFYNDGSHAVTYANRDLKQGPGKSFGTTDGSITHTGDNRTGQGDGDDEAIQLDLAKLPSDIVEVSIFITIHEALSKSQSFGQIKNTFVRIVNQDSNEELCRYDLANEFASAITIQVGSLLKTTNGEWSFAALGAGIPDKELGDVLGMLS